MRLLIRATLATGAIALIAPAAAGAAVTIGQSPPVAGTAAQQAFCATTPLVPRSDFVQTASTTGNPYTVPAGGGVITSWRSSSSSGLAQMRLRVFKFEDPTLMPLAESALETLPPGSTTFATRIPVGGGELLGLSVGPGSNGSDCFNSETAAGDVVGAALPGPIGGSETVLVSKPQVLLNVSAQLEPDADGDGYGDETQDPCPTVAGSDGPCPPNAFTIGKRKANKRKGTVKLTATVPSAGVVELSGKNVAVQHVEKAEAGDATLTVKPKGKAKKKLKSKGQAKLKATITFTPTGGEAAVQTTKVKLKLAG